MPFKHLLNKLKAVTAPNGCKAFREKTMASNSFSFVTFSYPRYLSDTQLYTDYPIDIINTLFEDEKKLFDQFTYNSNQIYLRECFVNAAKGYCMSQNYSIETVHLAVLFIDMHMSRVVLGGSREHLKLFSLIACLLAAKGNELDQSVPSIKELLHYINMESEIGINFSRRKEYDPKHLKLAYTRFFNVYTKIEFLLFESIGFSTVKPTIFSFLDIFQNLVVQETDIYDMKNVSCSFDELKMQANDFIGTFSMMVLHNFEFYKFLPSEIAAGIIVATRKLLGIKTYWNGQLEFLTRTTTQQIEPIYNYFLENQDLHDEFRRRWRLFNEKSEIVVEDSGYLSQSSRMSITSEEE